MCVRETIFRAHRAPKPQRKPKDQKNKQHPFHLLERERKQVKPTCFGTQRAGCVDIWLRTKPEHTRPRTVDTQWCPLELCNRAATGLHNVLVQMSERNCLGPSTAGWAQWSSGWLPTTTRSLCTRHKPHLCTQGPANTPLY